MDRQLLLYESMSHISGQMREAAQRNDWDQLCALEREVTSLCSSLRQEPAPARMDDGVRQRKICLIRQILADDREIRSHAEPWMDSVRTLLSSGARQRAVSNAYGVGRR